MKKLIATIVWNLFHNPDSHLSYWLYLDCKTCTWLEKALGLDA